MRKRNAKRRIFGALALGVAVAFAASARAEDRPPPVRLNPSITLTPAQYVRLQAVADQGIDALRRYIWRTRMIYGWRMSDLL